MIRFRFICVWYEVKAEVKVLISYLSPVLEPFAKKEYHFHIKLPWHFSKNIYVQKYF